MFNFNKIPNNPRGIVHLMVLLIGFSFFLEITYCDSPCTCSISGTHEGAILRELQQKLHIVINKQMKELQQMKSTIKATKGCPVSFYSYLEEMEKFTVSIRSLFGVSIKDQENEALQSSKKFRQNSDTKSTRAPDSSKFKDFKMKFEREQKEILSKLEKSFFQKFNSLETSLEETKMFLLKNIEILNITIKSINDSFDTRFEDLQKNIFQPTSNETEELYNCTYVNNKLENLTKLLFNKSRSKVGNLTNETEVHIENVDDEPENSTIEDPNSKDNLTKIEELLKQDRKSFDENIRLINGNISSLEFSIENIEKSLAANLSEVEISVSSITCNCPIFKRRLDNISKFLERAKPTLINNRYFVIDQPFSYDSAEYACNQRKARLATIPNETSQKLMEEKLHQLIQNGAWIGLKSNGRKDGIFQWSDGMTINVKKKRERFQNWHMANPEDYIKGPVCVRILTRRELGLWVDDQCRMKQAAFCEVPIE